jgi:hypothetical protein
VTAVYSLHGLRIRSEVALAGFPVPEGECDVDVRWGASAPVPPDAPPGRLLAARERGEGYWYVATEVAGEITLRVPGICDFVISPDAAGVECRADPATEPGFVGLVLAGVVTALLLALRGDVVLHASAVQTGGVAVALAGDSGAGKSTLATVLCAAGATLVTDDLLRVGPGPDDSVMCLGGAPQLRLRPHGAWAIDRFPTPQRVSSTADQRLALEPGSAPGVSVPLATIALIQPSRSVTTVAIEELTGASAVVRLAGVMRIAGWKDPTILQRQFHTLAWLARSARLVEAVIPWGPPLPDSVAPALLELATAR